MSAALQTTAPVHREPRGKSDRRRHQRVALRLGGRFMFEDSDHSLLTFDISCGGASLESKMQPPVKQSVICYFDDIGRVRGHVVRHLDDGFAIRFDASAHKRDKLADRLVWLINHKHLDLADERSAPRKAAGGPALVTRSDGSKLQCRVIDISLSGAAFEYEGPIPMVGEIIRAGSIKGEVVRSVTNEFAIRFLHKPQSGT